MEVGRRPRPRGGLQSLGHAEESEGQGLEIGLVIGCARHDPADGGPNRPQACGGDAMRRLVFPRRMHRSSTSANSRTSVPSPLLGCAVWPASGGRRIASPLRAVGHVRAATGYPSTHCPLLFLSPESPPRSFQQPVAHAPVSYLHVPDGLNPFGGSRCDFSSCSSAPEPS